MTRRRKAAPDTVAERPPGYYTEPVRAWFGADWQPATDWGGNAVVSAERATAARAVRLAAGDTGSIPGLSKRSDALLAASTIERARRRGAAGKGGA